MGDLLLVVRLSPRRGAMGGDGTGGGGGSMCALRAQVAESAPPIDDAEAGKEKKLHSPRHARWLRGISHLHSPVDTFTLLLFYL